MASNLPPGVSDGMIPGNTPEDVGFEKLFDKISESKLDAEEAHRRWDSQPELLAVLKAIEVSGLLSDVRGDASGGHLLANLRHTLLTVVAKAEPPIDTREQEQDDWHSRRFNDIR